MYPHVTESTRHSTPEYHRTLRRGFMGGVHTLTLSGQWSQANLYVVLARASVSHLCESARVASLIHPPTHTENKCMTTNETNSKELKRMLLLAVELDPRVLRLDGFNCSEARNVCVIWAWFVWTALALTLHTSQRAHTREQQQGSVILAGQIMPTLSQGLEEWHLLNVPDHDHGVGGK